MSLNDIGDEGGIAVAAVVRDSVSLTSLKCVRMRMLAGALARSLS